MAKDAICCYPLHAVNRPQMIAIYTADMPFIVIGFVQCAGCALMWGLRDSKTFAEEANGASIAPFIALFGIEAVALFLSFAF